MIFEPGTHVFLNKNFGALYEGQKLIIVDATLSRQHYLVRIPSLENAYFLVPAEHLELGNVIVIREYPWPI